MSLASIVTPAESTLQQLLLLDVGDALFAIDSRAVHEIVPTIAATRLPGAPDHVRGVMNLRGQLITVIDIGRRLTGTPLRNQDGSTIVVRSGEHVVGLSVDEVRDVQSIDTGAEALPYAESGKGALVKGMGRLGDEVVIVVDVDEIVRQTLA
jgi:purine-binding chemotaxis protein CheW